MGDFVLTPRIPTRETKGAGAKVLLSCRAAFFLYYPKDPQGRRNKEPAGRAGSSAARFFSKKHDLVSNGKLD